MVSRNADTIIPKISSDNIWLSYRQLYVKMIWYAKFNSNISCGSRVMSIFTKIHLPAKMMLGKPSSLFYKPVAGQY